MRYLLVLSIVFSLLAGAYGDWASCEHKSNSEHGSVAVVDDSSADPLCIITATHVFNSFNIASNHAARLSAARLSGIHHYEPQAARAPPVNNA